MARRSSQEPRRRLYWRDRSPAATAPASGGLSKGFQLRARSISERAEERPAVLAAIPANRFAAAALAELLSRRRSCERIAEALVRWSRAA